MSQSDPETADGWIEKSRSFVRAHGPVAHAIWAGIGFVATASAAVAVAVSGHWLAGLFVIVGLLAFYISLLKTYEVKSDEQRREYEAQLQDLHKEVAQLRSDLLESKKWSGEQRTIARAMLRVQAAVDEFPKHIRREELRTTDQFRSYDGFDHLGLPDMPDLDRVKVLIEGARRWHRTWTFSQPAYPSILRLSVWKSVLGGKGNTEIARGHAATIMGEVESLRRQFKITALAEERVA